MGVIPFSKNSDTFSESKWFIQTTSTFFVAKIKIVYKSSDLTSIPRIKNLRTIMLNSGVA